VLEKDVRRVSHDMSGAFDIAAYRLLAEALPHLVWFARPDGAVTYYNRQAELYGGLAPGADGIYEWSPIVHPDDLERTQQAWQRSVATQQVYESDHRVRMADGSFRWHLSRALPLEIAGATMWFGTATDTQLLVDAREALAESESRLRSVFTGLDQGYCVCELVTDEQGRPIDYRFLETNHSFAEATGLRDAVGRTALELVPSLEPHWLETYASVALGDTPLRFQHESPAMGRRFDVFATPVEPRGRFALVFSDVTERDEALEALQESEQRFRNMADHAPVMIWVTDPDGACTYLNRRWYEFTGQSEEDALGLGWLDATHPGDRDTAATTFADANERRSAFHLDYRLRRHDGIFRWAVDAAAPRFGADGRFLGFVGSVLDITARKEAEAALAAQLDAEHSIAVALQQSLLPTDLIDDPRIEMAATYVAGTDLLQVGGDWYETFHAGDGRFGLVVGDVVGHNVEAAAAMGQLRAGLLALAPRVDSPDELLLELDRFVRRHGITTFATALCLFLDPEDGAIEYSSAGHPPALLCARDGTIQWLDDARELPLGVLELDARPTATASLEPGAVLVAYSDGLIERRGEAIDVGLDRLSQTVRRLRTSTMDALCADTLDALVGDDGFGDDTVLVTLRRTGDAR
jgi:PAS domain S-box-containing protein